MNSFCMNCGKAQVPGAKFCSGCGTGISRDPSTSAPASSVVPEGSVAGRKALIARAATL